MAMNESDNRLAEDYSTLCASLDATAGESGLCGEAFHKHLYGVLTFCRKISQCYNVAQRFLMDAKKPPSCYRRGPVLILMMPRNAAAGVPTKAPRAEFVFLVWRDQRAQLDTLQG